MKTFFSLISDCFFTLVLTFIISFIILNYLIERPFSIAFSFILASLVTMLFFKISHGKYNKMLSQNLEQKEYENALFSLNFSTPIQNNLLLIKALNKKGYASERKKGGVFLPSHKVAVFLFFSFTDVTKAQVVKVFNSIPSDYTAYIVAPTFSEDVTSFICRFDGKIKQRNGKEFYAFLKDADCQIKERVTFKKEKKGLSLFKTLLEKRKAKRFLSFGLILLLMTFIVPFKIYYTVCGCIFLIYALILHLFGKTESREN